MFAARRKDRVIGRTVTLVVSISTKNGFSQSGAPSGRKCATNIFGLNRSLEMISAIHRGSPRDRVNSKWLEVLNVYGTRPAKLIKIIKINSVEIIFDSPLMLIDMVRFSCCSIMYHRIDMGDVRRD